MSEQKDAFIQRTLVLARPGKDLEAVSLALGLQSKNLFNTTHFCVNNVLSAYEKVEVDGVALYRKKVVLHENQSKAIATFNEVIDALNANRKSKYEAKIAKGGEEANKAKLTVLPRLEESVSSVYRSVLDQTVLDNVLRDWLGLSGVSVYSRLPAKAAQQVLRRYLNGWSGFFESMKVFAKARGAMTGQPRPPSYLAKKARYIVELPLTQMGESLIGLGKRSIPVDFEETIALTEAEMDAWNGYRIFDAIALACKKRGLPSYSAQHLRIVPNGDSVKLEVVVRLKRELPPNSVLAKVEEYLGEELQNARSGMANELLIGAVVKHRELNGVKIAGVDFGVNNTASMAFSTGNRAIVVSAARLEAVLDQFDGELDSLVSQLTTPECKELQRKQSSLLEVGQKLSRQDMIALRKALKEVFANPLYRDLRAKRGRWLDDYLHKLSCNMVQECSKRGIESIVLGQNKGWKDGMNMGSVQNRRFGNVPIARLIELIRYKANALGIVVVTAEESFTSKTSFVNNETLRVFGDDYKEEKKAKKDKKKKPTAVVEGPTSAGIPEPEAKALGRRLSGGERNTYVNMNQTGRWRKVHADVNAAFNIIRKVFRDFAFSEVLTLKFNLMRVSPRLGLTFIRI